MKKTVIGEIGVIARLAKTETRPNLILTALPPEWLFYEFAYVLFTMIELINYLSRSFNNI